MPRKFVTLFLQKNHHLILDFFPPKTNLQKKDIDSICYPAVKLARMELHHKKVTYWHPKFRIKSIKPKPYCEQLMHH